MGEGDNVELLTVAVDFQGSTVVKPYIDKAKASFTTVVDSENILARLCGFKAVPNGYFIEPGLKVSESIKGKFDIRIPELFEKTRRWIKASHVREIDDKKFIGEGMSSEEQYMFDKGLRFYQQGNESEAILEWQKLVEMDPKNFIVRKQICAIVHPDKFYAGDVDFDWQQIQMQREAYQLNSD